MKRSAPRFGQPAFAGLMEQRTSKRPRMDNDVREGVPVVGREQPSTLEPPIERLDAVTTELRDAIAKYEARILELETSNHQLITRNDGLQAETAKATTQATQLQREKDQLKTQLQQTMSLLEPPSRAMNNEQTQIEQLDTLNRLITMQNIQLLTDNAASQGGIKLTWDGLELLRKTLETRSERIDELERSTTSLNTQNAQLQTENARLEKEHMRVRPLTDVGIEARNRLFEKEQRGYHRRHIIQAGNKAVHGGTALADAVLFSTQVPDTIRRSDTQTYEKLYGVLPEYVIFYRDYPALLTVLDWHGTIIGMGNPAFGSQIREFDSYFKPIVGSLKLIDVLDADIRVQQTKLYLESLEASGDLAKMNALYSRILEGSVAKREPKPLRHSRSMGDMSKEGNNTA